MVNPTIKNLRMFRVFLMSLVIMLVDSNIIGIHVALPKIAQAFNLDLIQSQWLLNGSLAATAIAMASAARISEHIGMKKTLLYSLIGYAILQFCTTFCFDVTSIITVRILSGISFGFLFTLALLITYEMFPPSQQGFAIGLLTAVFGFTQAIGPLLLGTIITHTGTWRAPPLILGCIALLITLVFYKLPWIHDIKSNPKKINILDIILLTFGVFFLISAVNFFGDEGLAAKYIWLFFILGIACLIWFGINEYTQKNPLLELRVFVRKKFLISVAILFFVTIIYFGLLFSLSLFFINILHYSAQKAGIALMAMNLVFAVVSLLSGVIVDKIGVLKPLLFGAIMLMLSTALLMYLSETISIHLLILSLVFVGIAFAFIAPTITTSVILSIPKEKIGNALGLLFNFSIFAGAVGIAFAGRTLSIESVKILTKLIKDHEIILTTIQTKELHLIVGSAGSIQQNLHLFSNDLMKQLYPIMQHSFLHGFNMLMIVSFIIAIIIFVLACILRKV